MQTRFILGLLIVAALMVLSGGPGAARADIVVGTPLNISNTHNNASSPAGASDNAGNVIVAWKEDDISVSRSNDGGATWSPAVKINAAAAVPGSFAPWTSQGGAGVAWIGQAGDGSLWYVPFSTLTETWGTPMVIDPGPVTQVTPKVVGTPDGSDIDVIYGKPAQGGSTEIFAELSPDRGATFGTPQSLGIMFPGAFPGLMRNDQGSWEVTVDPDGNVVLWKRAAGSFSWHKESTTPAGARRAWIGQYLGSPVVYWETKVPPVSIWTLAIGGPGTPIQMSGAQTANSPVFAASGNNAIMTWLQINHDTSHSQVVGRFSVNGGATFGSIFPISPADQGATDAQPFLIGDTATVLYKQFVGGSSTLDVLTSFHIGGLPPPPKPTGPKPFGMEAVVDFNIHFARAEAAPAEPRRHLLLAWSDTAPGGSSTDIFVAPVGPSGDENCDGVVDAFDALGVLRIAAGFATHAACGGLANVDCMGDTPDAADAIAILDYAAGAPKTPPAGCSAIGA